MATKTLAASGAWTTGSTWSGGTQPGSGDDVVLNNAFNLTVPNASMQCRSFNMTGYSGTVTFQAGAIINVGDSVQGNVTFISGHSTGDSNCVWTLLSSASGNQFTSAGHTLGSVNTRTAGGSWTLQDDLSVVNSFNVTSSGTMNTNGKTVTATSIDLDSSAATLTLGASTINLTGTGGTNYFRIGQVTSGGTLNAGTSTINIGRGGSTADITPDVGATFNNVVSAGPLNIKNSNTFANLTLNGGDTAFEAAKTQTVTGTLTFNPADYAYLNSMTADSTTTLSAAIAAIDRAYIQDVTLSGAASPASVPTSLDFGNNSGFTNFGAQNWHTPRKNKPFWLRIALGDFSSPGSVRINPTLAAGDFQVDVDGVGFVNVSSINVKPTTTCMVLVKLSAAQMNGDVISVLGVDQSATKEWTDFFQCLVTAQ